MSFRLMLIDCCIASLFGVVTSVFAQEHHKGHSAAELNKQFQDPDLDVRRFVNRFETDSREIFAQRKKIVEAIGLRPGQAVADIGAGTGLFSWMFAERIGPKGTVYAVEIAAAFLKYMGEQARKRGLENVVKPVLSTQDTTKLPVQSTWPSATYRHFEHPGKVLASIHRSLRPSGQLIVIDLDLRQDSSAFVRERARAPKEVYFLEIQAAGFVPIDAKPPTAFKENFFAAFQRRQ